MRISRRCMTAGTRMSRNQMQQLLHPCANEMCDALAHDGLHARLQRQQAMARCMPCHGHVLSMAHAFAVDAM